MCLIWCLGKQGWEQQGEEMKTSESIKEIAAALAKAQAKIKGAEKDADNPFFNSSYATLASVWEACREQITANGLSVVQGTENGDSESVKVVTRLLHSSGEWIESEISVKPMKMKVDRADTEKQVTPQSVGSALTYARRYALAAMVGVAPEDDDGNAASQPKGQANQLPQSDMGSFEDVIIDVRQRNQKGPKGDFVIYTIETEEHGKLDTLTLEHATFAKAHKGSGEIVIIDSEPTKYGPKIKALARKEFADNP